MVGKLLTIPVLVFNVVVVIIILGLAGWYIDKTLTAEQDGTGTDKDLQGFEGNVATPDLVQSSLIAGLVAVASYIVGIHHLRIWSLSSAAVAQSAAWIAWLLLILPFSFAWKEIALDTSRGQKIKTLESFVIILTFLHFLYTILLYLPVDKTEETSRV